MYRCMHKTNNYINGQQCSDLQSLCIKQPPQVASQVQESWDISSDHVDETEVDYTQYYTLLEKPTITKQNQNSLPHCTAALKNKFFTTLYKETGCTQTVRPCWKSQPSPNSPDTNSLPPSQLSRHVKNQFFTTLAAVQWNSSTIFFFTLLEEPTITKQPWHQFSTTLTAVQTCKESVLHHTSSCTMKQQYNNNFFTLLEEPSPNSPDT